MVIQDWVPYLPLVSSGLIFLAIALAARPLTLWWDNFSVWWLRDLLPVMDSLNIDRQLLNDRMRWWGVAIVLVPVVVAFGLRLQVLAIPALVAVIFLPRIWLAKTIATRRKLIRMQLAGAMTGLANTSRAGLPLSSGIRTVAVELSEPLRSEFNWIVMNHQSGRPLSKVIDEARQRLNLESFTLFSATIQTTLERGGRVTDMLDRLSESLREMDRLERVMETTTASSRRVIGILCVFPVIFLGIFMVMFPEGTALMFSTPLGQGLLLLSMLLVVGGVVWGNKILNFR